VTIYNPGTDGKNPGNLTANVPPYFNIFTKTNVLHRVLNYPDTLLMRILNELEFGSCKVTLMTWNNRYIIKLEHGLLEQTFKISQFDVEQESQLLQLLSDRFIQQAMVRFGDMEKALSEALLSLQ
jgi:hypothetical protein